MQALLLGIYLVFVEGYVHFMCTSRHSQDKFANN